MDLFETMRLEDGIFKRIQFHTKRIQQSSRNLDINFNLEQWNQLLNRIAEEYPKGVYRVKIILKQNGKFDSVIADLPDKALFSAQLQKLPKNIPEAVLTNKTTNRAHLSHQHLTDLILLYDANGKILEFDIGNILIKEHDHFYTPTYNKDMLKGCMRQALIEQGNIYERDYDVDSFKEKYKQNDIQVYLINSLREVADVKIYI